jgi:hypothetical protein
MRALAQPVERSPVTSEDAAKLFRDAYERLPRGCIYPTAKHCYQFAVTINVVRDRNRAFVRDLKRDVEDHKHRARIIEEFSALLRSQIESSRFKAPDGNGVVQYDETTDLKFIKEPLDKLASALDKAMPALFFRSQCQVLVNLRDALWALLGIGELPARSDLN